MEHIESWMGRLVDATEPPYATGGVSLFRARDVLFGKLRPYLAKVWLADRPGACSTELLVLRARHMQPEFLHYSLLSDRFIEMANSATDGARMPRAGWEFIGSLEIWCPKREVQLQICELLDRETAKIDALIAKKEQLIDRLRETRAALVTQAVTKGLDRNASMKDSGIESLGKIPAQWAVKRLMWLTATLRPIMYGIVLPGPNVEEGVPIVKGGDVSPDRLRLDVLNKTTFEIEGGYARSRLAANDVVYAIRGSIGMAALVPTEIEGGNLTQDAARIAPGKGIHSEWLLYAVQSSSFFSMLDAGARGAAIRGINIWDLKRAVVAVPPEREQIEIARFLKRETAKLDSLVATIRDGIERLREFRTALISDAVTGKINVRRQLHDDHAAADDDHDDAACRLSVTPPSRSYNET